MRRTIFLGLLPALLPLTGFAGADGPGFRYYLAGDPADVAPATQGLFVMQGGGTSVDANFSAMGERGGGGDFVVLRASGADIYNDYILDLCACDSVETIVFESRAAADDPFVLRKIRAAEALFIAGGDQSRYVRFLKDTPVEDAINAVAAKPAPVGGTSAGMAVLGEFVYSAMSDTGLTTDNALADPYHVDVTLERDFLALPLLGGIVTDQHLIERDRIGRTLALLARLVADGWAAPARGIAADRETALHVDPGTGMAEVHATPDHETPYVYFLETSGGERNVRPGEPLSIAGIDVRRLAPGDRFDLRGWRSTDGIAYTLSVTDGRLKSSREAVY